MSESMETPESLIKALEDFEIRKAKYKGKEINNGNLYAGSPMYFYCKHCSIQTEVLPESYTKKPKKRCKDCKKLKKAGLI